MATVDPQPTPELNIREQLARIDDLLIDSQRKQREYHLSVWQVVAVMLGSAAAIFAAGAAIVKLIIG